jgi:hypothetical protein
MPKEIRIRLFPLKQSKLKKSSEEIAQDALLNELALKKQENSGLEQEVALLKHQMLDLEKLQKEKNSLTSEIAKVNQVNTELQTQYAAAKDELAKTDRAYKKCMSDKEMTTQHCLDNFGKIMPDHGWDEF